MKLASIIESDASKVADALRRVGVTKPFSTDHSVTFSTTPDLVDKVKFLLKHHGWQLHSISKPTSKGLVYADATPLKNKPYTATKSLYHITDRSRLEEIMRTGLNLKSETPGMRFPKRLYLYPTEQMAITRHRMANELKRFANKPMPNPVMLKINNDHGKYTTFIDPEYHMGMGANGDDEINVPVYTTKTVVPDDISIVGH